jgi:hypothetical protein
MKAMQQWAALRFDDDTSADVAKRLAQAQSKCLREFKERYPGVECKEVYMGECVEGYRGYVVEAVEV